MAEYDTILLDPFSWDAVADLSGNIAVASPPYALAQDAASECRLFRGEAYYDAPRGVPYWGHILGFAPPLSLARSYFVKAAMRVPGVVKAQVFFSSFGSNRILSGQVQVTDKTGATSAGAF